MTSIDVDHFVHVFEPRTAEPADVRPVTLLLLHGTGGDERDLLPLGRIIDPTASLLSPRGDVSERGMPRFFRRFAEGVFDLDDVRARAARLPAWLNAARTRYRLADEAIVAVGFSNGANIAAASLLLGEPFVNAAVLIRAMHTIDPHAPAPARPSSPAALPVLLLSGETDPIVPHNSAKRLAQGLGAIGARVDHRWIDAGHALTRADVEAAAEFVAVLAQAG